jgi:hypothetical protein
VLAIIVTVGVIFYGIDIKQAAKDAEESAKTVRDSANNMKDLRRDALLTTDEIQKSKEAIAADRLEAGKQLDQTKAKLSSLEEELHAIQATEHTTKKRPRINSAWCPDTSH